MSWYNTPLKDYAKARRFEAGGVSETTQKRMRRHGVER